MVKFTGGFLPAGGLQLGFEARLRGPLRPGRPRPQNLASPLSLGLPPAGPCYPAVSLPSFFCSLAAEEAGVEDPPDTGWRLCLRLHGPLHPEGLSPDGHELPFLFEQARLSRTHARGRPRSLNPSLSGPSLFSLDNPGGGGAPTQTYSSAP